MYGVISPAPDSFTSPSICQYVVCVCASQMFRWLLGGHVLFLLSILKIKVWLMQKQY